MSIAPIRLTILCAVLLSALIAAGTGLFLSTSRSRALVENQRDLANTALILARQMESVFNAVATVQNGTLEQIADFGGMAGDALQRLARHDVHIKLRDKAAGMPFVGSLTLFSAQGKVVNFSRQWPVPAIEANDRDFFKALRDDPNLNAFLGQPLRNRASGTWVMHLARKVSGPKGEFLGLISGAVELSYFDSFLSNIALALPSKGSDVMRPTARSGSSPRTGSRGIRLSSALTRPPRRFSPTGVRPRLIWRGSPG
jgi:hypothetical protein